MSRSDELKALRNHAPANTKLTVSRGARLKKQRSANLAPASGNMARYVAESLVKQGVIGSLKRLSASDKATIAYATRRATRHYESTGHVLLGSDLLG